MLVLPVSDSNGESLDITLQLSRRSVVRAYLPPLDCDVGFDCTAAVTAVVVGGKKEKKMRWHDDDEEEEGGEESQMGEEREER